MRGYFTAATEKTPISYRCGETITFDLKLTDGENLIPCDHFRWHLETDDGQFQDGNCSGELGQCRVETSISVPGFVHLKVTPCDIDGNPLPNCDIFDGGAGAEIEKLTPGLEEPKDYDAFWKQALSELNTISPDTLEMKEIESDTPGYHQYDVKVFCGNPDCLGGTPENRFGAPASGYLSVPEDVETGKLYPLELRFMGYSYVGATPLVVSDHITFHINPHGLPNGLTEEEYFNLREKTVGNFGFQNAQNRSPDTVYFKWMILRNIQALRWAKKLKGWDGKNIQIVGGSMGAFQSLAVASLCPEVTQLYIHVPWMCDLGGVLKNRLPGWRPEIKEGDTILEGIRYYDTVAFGRRIQCPVQIYAGLGDYICPPSSVAVLYNSIHTKKRIEWQQNRTHTFDYPPEMGIYVLEA